MKNPSYTIFDNALPFVDRASLYNNFFSTKWNVRGVWIDKNDIEKINPLYKLMILAGKVFDFSEFSGVEVWTHNLTAVHFHYDKDEYVFETSGQYILPMCSLIYYLDIDLPDLNIENFKDSLHSPDVMIVPKDNRLVIMAPGIIHGSNRGRDGIRRLIGIAPWVNKPESLPYYTFR